MLLSAVKLLNLGDRRKNTLSICFFKNYPMKIKHLFNLIVVFLLFAGCETGTKQANQQEAQSPASKDLTQPEVSAVIDKWLNLWATYDLDLLPEIFYQSPTLTYFSSEKEGLIKGYRQLLPHHEGFGFVKGGKKPPVALWLEDIEIRINGETAMVAATWYNGDKTAPRDSVQHGPVTFVLLRNDQGAVRISHAHFANN
jgi:ketosteroid isomerase-like protein